MLKLQALYELARRSPAFSSSAGAPRASGIRVSESILGGAGVLPAAFGRVADGLSAVDRGSLAS
jgi:hypothetical protein